MAAEAAIHEPDPFTRVELRKDRPELPPGPIRGWRGEPALGPG
jgi:hypothetical protein